MRILHVTDLIRPVGGAERAVATLCNALVADGHAVAVAHSDADATPANPTPHQLSPAVVRLYLPALFSLWPSSSSQRALSGALAEVAEWAPDIVHLHHVHNPVATMRLNRRVPVVQTHHTVSMICPGGQKLKHGPGTICTQPLGPACLISSVHEDCTRTNDGHRMRLRYVARRLAQVTALRAANARIVTNIVSSNYMREELLRSGYPPSRVTVIPLGVDIPSVDLSTVTRSHDVPCILVAGRLVRQKGVHVLLRALALVDQPFHLLIAGDGPMYAALKQVVKDLRLESRVSFLGWADGTRLLADTAPDIVVMPSLVPETFGLAGVEALAHGVPVVAFASGAIPEWLTDGETGWLAPPGHAAGLSAALGRALSTTQAERRCCGARGRAFVRAHFALAGYCRNMVACYEQCISAHMIKAH